MADGIEGRIEILLKLVGGRIAEVEVRSTRPVTACRVLEDRAVDDALSLFPRLFAICSTAQTHAALTACERALRVDVAPPQSAARRLLLLAETAREHAWRALLDWPALTGGTPEPLALRDLRDALAPISRHLYPSDDWTRTGGAPLEPDQAALSAAIDAFADGLDRHVVGGAGRAKWTDAETFERWCREGATATARSLGAILDGGLAGFGAGLVAALPSLDTRRLDGLLAADQESAFAAAPTWDGQAFETGPLVRCADVPVVATLVARHGNGVFARMAARLVELFAAPDQMRRAVPELSADSGGGSPAAQDGTGLAMIEMARGRLIYRVEIANGRVARYQVVAPTKWNFHPEGALVQGLNGREVDGAEQAKSATALAVSALDPCVAFEVSID